MKNIEVKLTRNHRLIYSLAKKFGADLHALDKICLAWIYENQNQKEGVIGVCKWDSNTYGIVDLFISAHLGNKKIMGGLVDVLLTKAKKDNINILFCHMGDIKIDYFLEKGFYRISEKDLPKDYFCACTVCPLKDKTCFPKPIMWRNI